MLTALSVKNFAIIDNINVEFKDGMTVLTGETGAGKSLIIDAIGLVLGKRAYVDMIRSGEEKATIEAIFDFVSDNIAHILKDNGIEVEKEDNLIIKREINVNGKSVCRINGSVVTLALLSQVGEFLGDIHSSEDTIGLINPKNYLSFLSDNSIDVLLLEYKNAYSEYRKAFKEYNELLTKNNEAKVREDFLLFSLKEFELAKLSRTEEEELKTENNQLKNYETIVEYIKDANDVYNGSSLDDIKKAIVALQKLSKIDPKYNTLLESLENSYYTIDSVLSDDSLKPSRVNFDEKRLDYINQRLSIYSDFKRKYNKDTVTLLDYYEELKQELDMLQNYEFYIKEAKTKLDETKSKAFSLACKLSELRKNFAYRLESEVLSNLNDLQLKNTTFKIQFCEVDMCNSGIDSVDFLVTFNKGEELKPLNKVASGGELSRFMLALKTALSKSTPLQVRIFDEVDHGVSGIVAHSIGQKIHSIALNCQVLCITHLPQVAASADYHLLISKSVEEGRTYSFVKELTRDERISEIAKMMSDGEVSEASLAASAELLDK